MFKVGDIVTISKTGTRWCHVDKRGNYVNFGTNPFGISGKIIHVRDSHLSLRVLWSNGNTNSYHQSDLEFFNFSLENK